MTGWLAHLVIHTRMAPEMNITVAKLHNTPVPMRRRVGAKLELNLAGQPHHFCKFKLESMLCEPLEASQPSIRPAGDMAGDTEIPLERTEISTDIQS